MMTEKKWFEEKRYYDNIDENRLKSIFYFSLIWNIFEKECCDNYASIGIHPKRIAENITVDTINIEKLRYIFYYYQTRYFSDNQVTESFRNFDFGRGVNSVNYKRNVSDILQYDNPDIKQILEALLLIAFRLRNNLFHGIKEVERLYEQNENFSKINQMLLIVIENYTHQRG